MEHKIRFVMTEGGFAPLSAPAPRKDYAGAFIAGAQGCLWLSIAAVLFTVVLVVLASLFF